MRTVNSSLRKPKNMVLQDVSKAEPQPVSVGQTSLRIMVQTSLRIMVQSENWNHHQGTNFLSK